MNRRIKDISCIRFGSLIAKEYAYTDESGTAMWKCDCDCGINIIISGYSLRSGKTTTCGNQNNHYVRNISNNIYGRLTVIEKTDIRQDSNNAILWKCRCLCGNEILLSKDAMKSGNTKSCGCLQREIAVKLGRETVGEKSPSWKGGKKKYNCDQCNIEFLGIPSEKERGYEHIFCSQRCMYDWMSETKSGKNSHLWEGGKTLKHFAMRNTRENKKWRISIFERDNYTCQKCEVRGGILNAHHITNFASIYEDNEDGILYNTNNGITFCQECHKKFHKKYGSRDNIKEQINEFIK